MDNPRLCCLGVNEIGWLEAPLPSLEPGQVLVKCLYGTEKHGTMSSFAKGVANSRGRWDTQALIHRTHEGMLWSYPIPLGNMQLGEVVESKGSLPVGSQVFFHGFFQPLSVVDEALAYPVPEGRSWKDVFLMDPAEFALGALRDGSFHPGDRVVVFGMGAIGLVVVQMLSQFGASWVGAVDPLPSRREAALAMGAHAALDPAAMDVGEVLKDQYGAPDLAIDFSGALPSFQSALRGIGYGGTIVMGSFPAPWPAGLDLGGEAHMNRPRVIFSRACSDPHPDHPRWSHKRIQEAVIEMIARGQIRGEKLFGEPSQFADLVEDYRRVSLTPGDVIKLAVRYD